MLPILIDFMLGSLFEFTNLHKPIAASDLLIHSELRDHALTSPLTRFPQT